jgi:transposase
MALQQGHTKNETAAVFKVGTSTLQKWKSQLEETCTLASIKAQKNMAKN